MPQRNRNHDCGHCIPLILSWPKPHVLRLLYNDMTFHDSYKGKSISRGGNNFYLSSIEIRSNNKFDIKLLIVVQVFVWPLYSPSNSSSLHQNFAASMARDLIVAWAFFYLIDWFAFPNYPQLGNPIKSC